MIAVSADRIYVLTVSGLVDVPQASVTRAQLDAYRTAQGAIAGWFILGLLSTASHGGYLLLSVPMWLIGGGVALSAESHAALISYPKKPFAAFRPYARFPQGLPADLERTELGELRGLRREPARR